MKKRHYTTEYIKAYTDIGSINAHILQLLTEAETYQKNGNLEAAKDAIEHAERLKEYLVKTYDSETYDLDYHSSSPI